MKQIKPLEPPDSIHLKAADGWIGLGNVFEAHEELEKISPLMRVHPDVLELRWQIYATERKWKPCVDIAGAIVKLAPERHSGWIYRSFALHELNQTDEAFENLFPVAEKFSDVWTIPYNLACYLAQLQRIDEAQVWLDKAFAIAKRVGLFDEVRLFALDDSDLDQFWKNPPIKHRFLK